MARKYVSRVDFSLDGKKIEDIKNFKEHELDVRDMVKLMNKTGYVNKTARVGFSVDYVIPADGSRIDFTGYEDVPAAVAAEDGKTINYTGAFVMKVGEADYDGEKEVVQTITFGAEDRHVV